MNFFIINIFYGFFFQKGNYFGLWYCIVQLSDSCHKWGGEKGLLSFALSHLCVSKARQRQEIGKEKESSNPHSLFPITYYSTKPEAHLSKKKQKSWHNP